MGQRITADKREIKDLPKLPSATSFIRKTLSARMDKKFNQKNSAGHPCPANEKS
nr:hypothetical protein [Candidatus Omnitrophota bacterium]